MQWNSEQIELFPRRKLQQSLLGKPTMETLDPEQICQQTIQTWKEFVVPYTPHESEMATRGFPPDHIADVVTQLLLQTTGKSRILSDPSVMVYIKNLVNIWPTIWIWIQWLWQRAFNIPKLNPGSLSEEQLETEGRRYEVTIQALLFFLGYTIEPEDSMNELNELTTLVKGTDGVLQMISVSWVEEGEDKNGAIRFCLGLVYDVIARCLDRSAEEVVQLAFNRIWYNIEKSSCPEIKCSPLGREGLEIYRRLGQHILFVGTAISSSLPLYAAFTAHSDCVSFFADYMLQLHHFPHSPLRFGLVSATVDVILGLISGTRSYAMILRFLQCGFLMSVTQAAIVAVFSSPPKSSTDHFNQSCTDAIVSIGQFSVYRSILSQAHRGLTFTKVFVDKSASPLGSSLRDLRSQINPFIKAYKDFKRSRSPAFCCGNRQCNSTGDKTVFTRCSGCILALYCSRDCQKRDWRGTHKVLCEAMCKTAHDLIPLRSPDLRWLAYLLTHEFIKDNFLFHVGIDSAGRLTAVLVFDYHSSNRLEKPTIAWLGLPGITQIGNSALRQRIPSGSLLDTWRSSLVPRDSGHGAAYPTQTVAVLVILPQQLQQKSANITALLTHPIRNAIPAEDVHVTWIYHQSS